MMEGIRPPDVRLRAKDDDQPSLFGDDQFVPSNAQGDGGFSVPRSFVGLAEDVGYHRDTDRWDLLYRVLWRLKHEQPHLLELTTDDDVYRLHRMEKQVRRDAHKMKAFVRFRKVERDDGEHFIAWHEPDHFIVRKVAGFFSRRFKGMDWTILTPHESVTWDRQCLQFGPGVPRSEAPKVDELEELWKTYYASIFNPARVKVKAMKNEMPVRYWHTMPETELIPDLLATAEQRVEHMVATQEGYAATAAGFIEEFERQQQRPIASLEELREVASQCTACDLHCNATQTVFGEGPTDARIIIVGEQPGDVEDREGRPFVGPAGQILDEALAAARVDREHVYVTNTVKHFKFEMQDDSPPGVHPRELRGKRRLHKRPNASEIRVCKPWIRAEWKFLTGARVLVCLGSTSATALIGPEFKIAKSRGTVFASSLCELTLATWHPSLVLRLPDKQLRQQRTSELIADLSLARELSEKV